jgi:hypothetical protein
MFRLSFTGLSCWLRRPVKLVRRTPAGQSVTLNVSPVHQWPDDTTAGLVCNHREATVPALSAAGLGAGPFQVAVRDPGQQSLAAHRRRPRPPSPQVTSTAATPGVTLRHRQRFQPDHRPSRRPVPGPDQPIRAARPSIRNDRASALRRRRAARRPLGWPTSVMTNRATPGRETHGCSGDFGSPGGEVEEKASPRPVSWKCRRRPDRSAH